MDLQEVMAQILAAPDDEGPRLVCADWLQEHGDPRGELIGLQCELERLPVDGAPRRAAIKRREAELMEAHQAAWLPAFDPPDSSLRPRIKFRRGFIEEACVRTARAEADLAALFAVTPFVRKLVLEGPGRGEEPAEGYRLEAFQALQRFPAARLVARLELREPRFDDRDATLLASVEALSGLTSLKCVDHDLGDPGAVELAVSPHLRLRELVLPQGTIGDAGAWAIFESDACARLTHLDLSGNLLGEKGRKSLRDWFERHAEAGWWVVAAGGTLYRKVEKDPFIVGRGPLCDVVLRSRSVNREHLGLFREKHGWVAQSIGGRCSLDGREFLEYPLVEHAYELGDETIQVLLKR